MSWQVQAEVWKIKALATLAFYFRLLQRKLPFLLRFSAAPLPGDDAVSAAWLDNLLHEKGVINGSKRVESVSMSLLGEHRGLVGSLYRLKVQYSGDDNTDGDDGGSNAEPPVTFVMKTSNEEIAARMDNIAGGRPREATFYNYYNRGVTEEITPQVLYAYGNAMLGEYVIVMEDLALRQGITANMLFGNQVWGVPEESQAFISRHPVLQDKRALLHAIFNKVAIMHANHWKDPSLLQCADFKGSSWYHDFDEGLWLLAIERARSAWAVASKRTDVQYSPKLVSVLTESYRRASWRAVQRHLRSRDTPFTLCHGDFHASNMYISVAEVDGRPEVQLCLYDWSEVGPWEPCTDLAQCFISDIPRASFKELAEPVMREYWETLVKQGVSATEFSFEQCWESFCRGGVERWLFIFPVLASFLQLPGSAVQYFHDQLLAFIEEFGDQPYYFLKPVVCLA